MSLRSFLANKRIVSCRQNTPVTKIAEQMKTYGVGTVIIIEDGKPLGIVTDRDIVTRCLAHGFDPVDMEAQHVMTIPVQTVDVNQGIYDVVGLMREQNIRRVVVTDDKLKPIGLLSMGDVMELLTLEMAKLVGATDRRRAHMLKQAVA